MDVVVKGVSGLKLLIASDHGGFELKEKVKALLANLGVDYEDIGPSTADPVDYPDFACAVASRISSGPDGLRAILICGTGIGMSIAANTFAPL